MDPPFEHVLVNKASRPTRKPYTANNNELNNSSILNTSTDTPRLSLATPSRAFQSQHATWQQPTLLSASAEISPAYSDKFTTAEPTTTFPYNDSDYQQKKGSLADYNNQDVILSKQRIRRLHGSASVESYSRQEYFLPDNGRHVASQQQQRKSTRLAEIHVDEWPLPKSQSSEQKDNERHQSTSIFHNTHSQTNTNYEHSRLSQHDNNAKNTSFLTDEQDSPLRYLYNPEYDNNHFTYADLHPPIEIALTRLEPVVIPEARLDSRDSPPLEDPTFYDEAVVMNKFHTQQQQQKSPRKNTTLQQDVEAYKQRKLQDDYEELIGKGKSSIKDRLRQVQDDPNRVTIQDEPNRVIIHDRYSQRPVVDTRCHSAPKTVQHYTSTDANRSKSAPKPSRSSSKHHKKSRGRSPSSRPVPSQKRTTRLRSRIVVSPDSITPSTANMEKTKRYAKRYVQSMESMGPIRHCAAAVTYNIENLWDVSRQMYDNSCDYKKVYHKDEYEGRETPSYMSVSAHTKNSRVEYDDETKDSREYIRNTHTTDTYNTHKSIQSSDCPTNNLLDAEVSLEYDNNTPPDSKLPQLLQEAVGYRNSAFKANGRTRGINFAEQSDLQEVRMGLFQTNTAYTDGKYSETLARIGVQNDNIDVIRRDLDETKQLLRRTTQDLHEAKLRGPSQDDFANLLKVAQDEKQDMARRVYDLESETARLKTMLRKAQIADRRKKRAVREAQKKLVNDSLEKSYNDSLDSESKTKVALNTSSDSITSSNNNGDDDAELTALILSLRTEVVGLRSQLVEAQAAQITAKNDRDLLENNIATTTICVQKLQDDIATIRRDVQVLREKSKVSDSVHKKQTKKLAEEVEKIKTLYRTTEERLNNFTIDRKLEEELTETQSEAVELRNQVAAYMKQIELVKTAAEEKIKTSDLQGKKLRAEIDQMRHNLDATSTQVIEQAADHLKQIKQKDEKLIQYQQTIEDLQSQRLLMYEVESDHPDDERLLNSSYSGKLTKMFGRIVKEREKGETQRIE